MANKKKSRTLILLIFLCILCGGAYLCIHGYMSSKNKTDEDGEADEASSEQLLSETIENATRISYKKGDKTIVLVNEKDTWKLKKEKDCPIDQSKVSDMLSVFASTDATKKIADNQDNQKEYGLDQPSLIVTLTLKDKSSISYKVGISAIGSSEGYYVSTSEKEGIYLAPVTVYSPFQYSEKQLVAIEAAPEITSDYIFGVTVKKGNSTIFGAKGSDGDYVITSPYKEVEADADSMSTILDNYTSYAFTENVDYTGKDLEKYGLNHPAYTIEVKYYEAVEEETENEDSETGTAAKTKKGNKKTFVLSVGNQDNDGNYYVQRNDSASIYLMSQESISTLTKTDAFALVEKTPVSIELDTVKTITFNIGKQTYTLDINAKEADETSSSDEKVYNATFNGKEIEDASAISLYDKLTALEYKEAISDKEEGKERVLSIQIKYGDKSQYTKNIVLNTYDSNYDQVITDQVAEFAVDKRAVDELVNALKNM